MKKFSPFLHKLIVLTLLAGSSGVLKALADPIADPAGEIAADPGEPAGPPMASGEDDQDHQAGMMNAVGHKAFGPKFYQEKIGYPVVTPRSKYRELDEHAIPLNPGARADDGADRSGWVPVPLNDHEMYYRAEYHIKDIRGINIDSIVDKVTPSSNGGKFLDEEREQIRNQAKFQMVVFPTDSFQLEYFPGHMLLMTDDGGAKGKPLNSPRGGSLQWNSHFNRLYPQEIAALAGVFKAAFDNPDGRHNGRLPGLIVNGQTVDTPHDELAGIAIYKDGSLKMGRYRDFDHKENIQFLRQNEYPILEHGNLTQDGAFPRGWNRFSDDIMRSYYTLSGDGKYIAFLWTNFCPPALIASTLQNLHFSEMILGDIHPSIGAAVARAYSKDPNAPLDFFSPAKEPKGSYYLVQPEDLIINNSLLSSGMAAWRHIPMQWGFESTKVGSQNDFYAIVMKH